MNTGMIIAGIACAGLLAACASQPGLNSLTREQREKVSTTEVFYGEATRPGTIIGQVKGTGCQKDVHDSRIDSENEAIEELKFAAARINADAVINTTCQERKIDWSAACWGLFECSGEAFRYER